MKKLTFYRLIFVFLHVIAQGTEMDSSYLLPNWDVLKPEQRQELRKELQVLDLEEIQRQKNVLTQDNTFSQTLLRFKDYEQSGSEKNKEIGTNLIAQGKVGCLIVAGGQGSRLGSTKPKGLFPVTVIQGKTFFQLFAEKILAAGKQVGYPLSVAIMTSSKNHEYTLQAFQENHYFGLNKDQIFFFSQKDLPFLDVQGNLFLETPTHIAKGADGNASSLRELVSSGIWEHWHKEGIEYVNYLHIDNPLADPFDPELTGYHSLFPQSDLIIKCIARDNPEEQLGVIFEIDGKIGIIEYLELSKEDASLKNVCGNIGLYSFRMDFIREVALNYYDKLPLHKAWKAVKYLDAQGITKKSKKPNAWKFEKFIFDVMPFAKNVKALLYPRAECFAPLKNAEGQDSLFFVQKALQKKDRSIYEKISGKKAPSKAFELDPTFYYPTKQLLQKWKGKDLPQEDYIIP